MICARRCLASVPDMVILYEIHKQMSCFPVSIVVQTLDNQISSQTNNRIYVTILFYNIVSINNKNNY
jgi:hypothetical protein